MTPEIIQAIGEYIVIPICTAVGGVSVLVFLWKVTE